MDKQKTARERQLEEIARLTDARNRTKSVYLKKDYSKGIKRLRRELAEYDRLSHNKN